MSEYIINPKWFYLVDVICDLEVALMFICGLSLVVLVFFVVAQSAVVHDTFSQEEKAKEMVWLRKAMKLFAIPAVCILFVVFLPSKETMYEMMIAKYITHENISFSVEAIKSAVDYIIEALKAVN